MHESISAKKTYHIGVNNLFGLQELHCRANLGCHIQKYLHLLNKYTVFTEINIQGT